MPTSWTSSRDSIGDFRVTEADEQRVDESGAFDRITEGISWYNRTEPTTSWTPRTQP